MKTATRPHLYFTDAGDGEPVLLVTGWTISSAVFDPILEHYTERVRLVAYDHRGSGRSSHWAAPVSIPMLAADAARVLDDRLLDHAHVVGLSMGAMVALELALRMPSRVRSLVLVGGTPGGPLAALPPASRAARSVAELAVGSARRGRLNPAPLLFSAEFRRDHPDKVRELIRPFAQYRPPLWTTHFQTLATSCFARGDSLSRVRTPTLVVHGDQDVMSPLANATMLADGIPGARLWVARGAGHAVPLERPEEAAKILCDWCEEHASNRPPQASGWERATERLTRPFALQAGTLRAVSQLPRGLARKVL
jgi:pimeloyl-ACP methyl ester carboxylesterase